MADPTPSWVSLAIALLGPIGTVSAFVFGRASKSGADEVKMNALIGKVAAIEQTLNDTVITLSNHGQSIRMTSTEVDSIKASLQRLNEGVATLLERTKKL